MLYYWYGKQQFQYVFAYFSVKNNDFFFSPTVVENEQKPTQIVYRVREENNFFQCTFGIILFTVLCLWKLVEKREYEKNWDPYLKEAIFSVLLKVEYSVQKMGNKQNGFLLSVVNAGLEWWMGS